MALSPDKSPIRQWQDRLQGCQAFHRPAMRPRHAAVLQVRQAQYPRRQNGSDAAKYNVDPHPQPTYEQASKDRHQHPMNARSYARPTSNYNVDPLPDQRPVRALPPIRQGRDYPALSLRAFQQADLPYSANNAHHHQPCQEARCGRHHQLANHARYAPQDGLKSPQARHDPTGQEPALAPATATHHSRQRKGFPWLPQQASPCHLRHAATGHPAAPY